MKRVLHLSFILLAIFGWSCGSNTGPDSNQEAFKTPEQAAAARKAKLMSDWQDLACRISNAQRPDVLTIKHPSQPFSLRASADGVQHTIDLNPIFNRLMANQGREREPLVEYLDQQMPEFDRARLKAIGFDRARELMLPLLANMKQTDTMARLGKGKLIVNALVIDLNWLPVARWPNSEMLTPIDSEIAAAWKTPESAVSAAAMANLKRQYGSFREPFDTTELPGLGRYGTLRSDANAAFVLLPEFLAAVRRQWNTKDDLVLFMPSRNSVTFVPMTDKKVLDGMYPEWSSLYTRVSEPLIGQLILAGDSGLTLYNYTPPSANTRPRTQPASRRVYIVN